MFTIRRMGLCAGAGPQQKIIHFAFRWRLDNQSGRRASMVWRRAKSAARVGVLTVSALVDSRLAFGRDGAPPQLECYSIADTRREIAEHKLADPFPSMQAASVMAQAEALSARLCRSGDIFVYEISLLRRDGRIVKTLVDAASGKPHPMRIEPKPEPRSER
jgi:hypothetical protein